MLRNGKQILFPKLRQDLLNKRFLVMNSIYLGLRTFLPLPSLPFAQPYFIVSFI